ncbi:MAG: hypothetical protein AAFZ15_22180 [Bacteroidota bacterium]
MKKYPLLFAVIFFFPCLSNAQLGFTIAPTQGFSEEWQVLVENYVTRRKTEFLQYGITSTIDYTFQLKAPEWQLAPAVHAAHFEYLMPYHHFIVYTVGLQGNFNLTPFKALQLREMKRSRLYIQLSPGLDFVQMKYIRLEEEFGSPSLELKDRKLVLNGGINFLLDLKLTHLLTVSPMAGVRYFPNLSWAGFSEVISEKEFSNEYDAVNWRHFTVGMRIGLNLEPRQEDQPPNDD